MTTLTNLNLELRAHPAQARLAGVPLTDSEGKPVPMFPDQRSVWLNGKMVGYCGTAQGAPISLIYDQRKIPVVVREAIREFVAAELGNEPGQVFAPPVMPKGK